MSSTSPYGKNGLLSGGDAQIRFAASTKTTEGVGLRYPTNFRTPSHLLTTRESCLTPLLSSRSDVLTMRKDTNVGISDGNRVLKTLGTHGPRSQLRGAEKSFAPRDGRVSFHAILRVLLLGFYAKAYRRLRSWRGKQDQTLVYDLVNAGPNHRFATANAIVANCTLGLGFGMGASKFAATCEKTKVHLDPCPKANWVVDRRTKFIMRNVAHLDWGKPEDEAKVAMFMAADGIVTQWRGANPQVVALWRRLEDALRGAAERNVPVHYFTLPSGRRKPYWRPHQSVHVKTIYDAETGQPEQKAESKLSAYLILGDKMPRVLHGGPLTENLVQATARDIMFHGALGVRKEAPQWAYMFNIYDELVFEVPLCDVEAAQKVIPELLVSGPMLAWARGLPLEVEGGPADKYTKHDPRWRKHSGMVG